jgi:hypothetical protein
MKILDDYAGLYDDMDITKGIGKLWHEIVVNASYSHRGSYDRWMPLNEILRFPYWEDKMKTVEGEDEVYAMLCELEARGKVKVHLFEGWTVKVHPDLAKQKMEADKKMAKVVEKWENEGKSSFTYGT